MKHVKTQAEIAAHEAEKKVKCDFKKATTQAKNIMKAICEKKGLRTAEIQMDYARQNPNAIFNSEFLSQNQVIEALQMGIDEYRQELLENNLP